MLFLEDPRFPDSVAFGFSGGPRFSTSITALLNGVEKRNANWSRTKGIWKVDHANKPASLTDLLVAHFYAVNGMAYGFRFKDWADYTVVAATTGRVLATDDPDVFQMIKRYTRGALTHDRIITKPLAGATFTGGGVYTYDTATGLITRTSGASPTAWTGPFDIPVRFGSDDLDIEGVDMSNEPIFSWNNIEIHEIRHPAP